MEIMPRKDEYPGRQWRAAQQNRIGAKDKEIIRFGAANPTSNDGPPMEFYRIDMHLKKIRQKGSQEWRSDQKASELFGIVT